MKLTRSGGVAGMMTTVVNPVISNSIVEQMRLSQVNSRVERVGVKLGSAQPAHQGGRSDIYEYQLSLDSGETITVSEQNLPRHMRNLLKSIIETSN